jgi:hypothetical protein
VDVSRLSQKEFVLECCEMSSLAESKYFMVANNLWSRRAAVTRPCNSEESISSGTSPAKAGQYFSQLTWIYCEKIPHCECPLPIARCQGGKIS